MEVVMKKYVEETGMIKVPAGAVITITIGVNDLFDVGDVEDLLKPQGFHYKHEEEVI